jgi:uncharacterized protein YutD
MQWNKKVLWFFAGLFFASIVGVLYPGLMPWVAALSFVGAGVLWWKKGDTGAFVPRSKAFKEMQKIQKKCEKIATDRYHHINDQIDYIELQWGYTQEQKRTIDRFLRQRAYTQMYHKLSASLLPQLIALVDHCNQREQKGCKREVSRRIRELTLLMKEELKRKKSQNQESFEVTLEVYDHLLREGK